MKNFRVMISWLAVLLFLTSSVAAQEKVARCVLGPPFLDGRAMRELAAQPQQWRCCRKLTGLLLFADHAIQRHFPEDETLTGLFKTFREMNLPIELEVGAVKEWGHTGEACFRKQTPMWERFTRCGALIAGVAMDEPLAATARLEKDMAHAARETADFVARVREKYPAWHVGDIEAFPSASAEDLIRWIDLLEENLKQRGVRGLDFFRLDVDWMHFVHDTGRGTWRDVRRIEEHCRAKKIPFSVVFWAANYPAMEKKGLADDAVWYVGTLQMAADYAAVGGRPDQIVVQSWVGAPKTLLPEMAEFSFTRSARDVFQKYGKE